jgi:delta 1-pyrroline-5-carboxylate dehydrogenase
MEMSLTCASDAYKFNLGANVRAEGGAVTGSWSEASRNISGSLQGRGAGGNYELLASTAGFNANIALKTSGSKQSVTMRADSQFRGANIQLSK